MDKLRDQEDLTSMQEMWDRPACVHIKKSILFSNWLYNFSSTCRTICKFEIQSEISHFLYITGGTKYSLVLCWIPLFFTLLWYCDVYACVCTVLHALFCTILYHIFWYYIVCSSLNSVVYTYLVLCWILLFGTVLYTLVSCITSCISEMKIAINTQYMWHCYLP